MPKKILKHLSKPGNLPLLPDDIHFTEMMMNLRGK